MSAPTVKFKISGMPKDTEYNKLSFGRKIEYREQIKQFKETAKSTHLSQKRQSYSKAIREFVKLNNVTEYYCSFYCDPNYYDDSFEFFYKTKEEKENG